MRGATIYGHLSRTEQEFQPTRPLRGATSTSISLRIKVTYFNPRAPCGARPSFQEILSEPSEFQPTRPLRGATSPTLKEVLTEDISTHAPLAGRDRTEPKTVRKNSHFNPRAPCGARPQHSRDPNTQQEFQPTRPLRGATTRGATCGRGSRISTHAPLAGRDSRCRPSRRTQRDFNPRAPCGARPSPTRSRFMVS